MTSNRLFDSNKFFFLPFHIFLIHFFCTIVEKKEFKRKRFIYFTTLEKNISEEYFTKCQRAFLFSSQVLITNYNKFPFMERCYF